MGDQFTLAEIRARESEDRLEHVRGVLLTVRCDEVTITVDICDQEGDGPMCRTRPGDGCRGDVDEGVVRRVASLLIEKNEKTRAKKRGGIPFGGAATTVELPTRGRKSEAVANRGALNDLWET